ncbi:hypothetical protein [Halomarina litorea]|uniref:hypothetical protein n=1 Tax=Halomarina litorea TaxID=2961595 RepID=UPI0020C4632A|nr:hypothetical protein [Halomarina sp. BCD28]
MALEDLWALEMLIAAFAGGAFGAALGALPAFIFTGFAVIAGEAANVATRAVGEAGGVDPEAVGTTGITSAVAFGPVFSPAISFAGGVAAAAYASRRGYMDTGFDYHEAKNIAFALGTKPDVLAVGGVFGVLGYWLTVLSGTFALPYDSIAMGVVLSAGIARVAFGYPLIGKVRGASILDMSPFAREQRRVIGDAATRRDDPTADGGEARGRFMVEPWLPHQYEWANVATIGVVVGILGAFIAIQTGSTFLAFGISAASLVFLNCGVEQIPVTHHISLVSSAAAVAVTAEGTGLVSGGLLLAVLVGGLFGCLAALFGELFQRIFYAHGDTHWDPPAAAIVFGSFLIAVCYLVGIFPGHSYVPVLGA